jgi:glycyl-tRNA synthetase alpha chain
MLDGLEISQFTYFQQCGGVELEVVPAELTYGLERLTAFLQNVDSVYDIHWNEQFTYRDVRFADERQYSVYNFELADVDMIWKEFELHEAESRRLAELFNGLEDDAAIARFPLLAAHDQTLKCSHLFNILDARGAISVTERVGVIQRVRNLAVGVAQAWMKQQYDPARGQQSRDRKGAASSEAAQ